MAWLALVSDIRRDIRSHLGNRVGSHIGIAVAFGFAVYVPGRALRDLLARNLAAAVSAGGLVVLSTVVIYVSRKRGGRVGRYRLPARRIRASRR
ncbi:MULTISPECIES: hypothetical protein [unclassified Arthrobacter]|uniref:hypothetical protein n=1 Tax=unclassified Arthrobacter TaxID=235627 RepID=UPI00339A7C61